MTTNNNPFEFLQQFWNQASTNKLFQPLITPEECDQKIAELMTIEQWLKAQLLMVETGRQTLELQKAGLRGFTDKPHTPPVET